MTTATPGYVGSVASLVLDSLSGAMGITNELGPAPVGEARNIERVVWAMRSRRPRPIRHQPDGGFAIAEKAWLFDVHLFATDFNRLDELADRLHVALDDVFGREAYELGDATAGAPDPSVFALVQSVTIRSPVYSVIHGTTTIETMTLATPDPDPDSAGAAPLTLTDAAGARPTVFDP